MKTRVLALVAGALVLAGCGGGGGNGETTTAAPSPTTTILPATTTAAQATVIDIRIVGGKPVGGIKRVTVEKPQLVDLVVHSDVADEVHLHGYDLHQDVEAGGTARIRFRAKLLGVFEAELENRKLQILELTVK